jgi:signal transduction histidine kinase/HAMP domain-containing protein
MKSYLRNAPIRQKLTIITMLTSGVALLVAGVAILIYERQAFKREAAADLATLAEMIAFNSASAVSFDDAASAVQTLQSLAAERSMVAACVYAPDGSVFATYVRAGETAGFDSPVKGQVTRFVDDRLEHFQPIVLDGETIGAVYLRADLLDLRQREQRYAYIMVVVGIAAMVLAHTVASGLRAYISHPVSKLSGAAQKVASHRDYSVRVEREGDDELGRLTDAFNHMLAQIQVRDVDLQATHDQLEKRVEQRTAELAYERDQLRALLDSSPDAIYFKDRDSRFVLMSRCKAEKMLESVPGLRERLGIPSDVNGSQIDLTRFVGLSDHDTYAEAAARRARADEEAVMRTGRPLVGQIEHQVYRDGSVCWSLTSKMPWRDSEGKIIGTFGLSRDITAQKRAEEELESANRKLVETSRAAGMAEVATGVLHNVGNVLNSVNVSATLVGEAVRGSKAVNLRKLSTLLSEHRGNLAEFLGNDDRGRMVEPYLATLADDLEKERASVIAELDHLRKNIDHIKDIVAMQQSYAKTSGVVEVISIPDLLEDAIRMNAGSLARHEVSLVRHYDARPVVTVDKHKVLQILVNVIRNAKYACDEAGRPDKRIEVRVAKTETGVAISISDNGVGIPAGNLTRIFNHGFTTRATGHGFGLHSGALAAREMGGSLEALSEGPGKGATFVLNLPSKPVDSNTLPT